jgi:adenylate cyclase
LALLTARIASGVAPGSLRIRGDGTLELGDAVIPADEHGRLLVNYYGGEGTFPRYSAGSILPGDMTPEVLSGAVVFIGTVGIATYDLVDTPFTETLPLLEKDATVAANILARTSRDGLLSSTRSPRSPRAAMLLFAAGAAPRCRFWLSPRSPPCSSASISRSSCRAGAWRCRIRCSWSALWAPRRSAASSWPRSAGRAGYGGCSRATSPARRRSAVADPEVGRLGERRESRSCSPTSAIPEFSEQHPPEEVVRTLNEYLGAMTDVVLSWEGTVDKFIGDAIVAFWGAPLPQADHAERALRCALQMCNRLDRLNAAWNRAGRPAFEIGVGLNTGQVLVGNIGGKAGRWIR